MRSLGTRIALIISAVLLCLMLVVATWVDHGLTQAIKQEEIQQAEVHSRSLLASLKTLMLNGNGTLARQWIDRLKGTAGIQELMVLTKDGEEAFLNRDTVDAVNQYIGAERFSRAPIDPVGTTQFLPDAPFKQALAGETAFDFHIPDQITIFLPIPTEAECLVCHGYDAASLRGVLRLSLSTELTDQRIDAMRNTLWAIAFFVAIALGIILWWSIRMGVLRPIAALRDAITRAGEGDRSADLAHGRRDELGEVAQVFNRMQAALRDSEVRIRAVMDNVVDGIITIDAEGVIELVNPAAARIFGYTDRQLIGENVSKLMPAQHAQEHHAYLQSYLATGQRKILGKGREVVGLRADGSTFPMDIAVSEMWLGTQRRFIGVIRDITDRKAQTAALRHQALHDALTGLPNRTLLYDRMQQAIRVGAREGSTFALMIMDLDRFKEINDTLGHHIGDKILQLAAQRTKDMLRDSDTVARLGGDEFAILLPGATETQTMLTGRKILDNLSRPLQVDEHSLEIAASLGIALYPRHGDDTVLLMKRADVAMYNAKRGGLGCAVYNPDEDQHSVKSLQLASELRGAIEKGLLTLCYQPKVELATGRITGLEALVRWRHPVHGEMLPDEFIPQAEQLGLIRALTQWVIRRTLTECGDLMQEGIEISLSVNLSARNLQDPDFPTLIQDTIAGAHVCANHLKLEITETAIMADPMRALDILHQINAMGLKLSIDDFGTGYSSLAYLRQLPVDEIKIDKSFVIAMEHDDNSVVIVRSTIDLAHNLGLRVVAEGVETEATYRLLRDLGCDAAQGYYIARPAPLNEIRALLNDRL